MSDIDVDEQRWWSFVNPCTDEQGVTDYQSVAERMNARIAQLEATNAALVAFVAATDANIALVVEQPNWCEISQDIWELDGVFGELIELRQLLATDHGIPLPGQEG